MEVTEFGMTTEVKLVHPLNKFLSIKVTELWKVIEVNLFHSLNPYSQMEVTVLGMMNSPGLEVMKQMI